MDQRFGVVFTSRYIFATSKRKQSFVANKVASVLIRLHPNPAVCNIRSLKSAGSVGNDLPSLHQDQTARMLAVAVVLF